MIIYHYDECYANVMIILTKVKQKFSNSKHEIKTKHLNTTHDRAFNRPREINANKGDPHADIMRFEKKKNNHS